MRAAQDGAAGAKIQHPLTSTSGTTQTYKLLAGDDAGTVEALATVALRDAAQQGRLHDVAGGLVCRTP